MVKLKQYMRWILPLVLVAVIATAFVVVPAVSTYAAGWSGK